MYDLNGFERDVLYVAAGKDGAKGVDLRRELDKYYDVSVQDARLYTALDKLAEKGLVNKTGVDGRSNSYTVTEHGEQKIESRNDWESKHLSPKVSSNST